MKNEVQMNSTSQTFRPFSSSLMSRPSTGRPSTAKGFIENDQSPLQMQVQEAEDTYLKLDNQFEDEIVRNVHLKAELQKKLQLKAKASEKI